MVLARVALPETTPDHYGHGDTCPRPCHQAGEQAQVKGEAVRLRCRLLGLAGRQARDGGVGLGGIGQGQRGRWGQTMNGGGV